MNLLSEYHNVKLRNGSRYRICHYREGNNMLFEGTFMYIDYHDDSWFNDCVDYFDREGTPQKMAFIYKRELLSVSLIE